MFLEICILNQNSGIKTSQFAMPDLQNLRNYS